MYVLMSFLIIMIGSCFGSFLHVCFSRTGWISGRSRCDACGYTLKWYDLIPIFSYLFLRGKCRKCKTKISISHIVSELMMGASFLCSFFSFMNLGAEYGIIVFIGLSFMTAAAIQDYIEKQIYTVTLLGGIIATAVTKIMYLYVNGMYIETIKFIAIVFIMKMIFLLVSLLVKDKIGDGDFDLFIIMYCICGGYGTIYALTLSCLTGCIIYIPLLISKKMSRKSQLPFAPLLLTGTIIYLLL